MWVEWWSKRNGCFVVIDGNERYLYMEVQTSGTERFMMEEWMWEWLTGNKNGRLLMTWEREWSGLEWVAGLVYGIEHGRCHGRKHSCNEEGNSTSSQFSLFLYCWVNIMSCNNNSDCVLSAANADTTNTKQFIWEGMWFLGLLMNRSWGQSQPCKHYGSVSD